MRYLGIDWGEKRIGLALADSETKTAMPFKVISDVGELLNIIQSENINIIVIGQPIKMSGDKRLSKEFIKFIDLLKSQQNLPVKLIDERLSSKHADALPGGEKAKAPRDAVAAMLILQTYLDQQN